ncbi:MAG: ankyrin repeat domain-containing protein [Planctomycetaceae bacterium]
MHSWKKPSLIYCLLLALLFFQQTASAQELEPGPPLRPPGATDLLKFNWPDDQFFDQPQMIAACAAVRKCSLRELRLLHNQGINWNTQGRCGMTILLLAFLSEDLTIYQQLLEWGADPNLELNLTEAHPIPNEFALATMMSDGDSVLHMAARFPRSRTWLNTSLRYGPKAMAIHSVDGTNILQAYISRPLNLSPSRDVTNNLISRCRDLNHRELEGQTASMLATKRTYYEVAALLLKSGASADCYDLKNQQLIHYLAEDQQARLRLFAEFPDARDNWQQSSARAGWEELLRLLQERGYSLEQAMEDLERKQEFVDDMPYLAWRRRQREGKDSCVPAPATQSDQTNQ